jgi:uncharacterized protein YbjQ (UPF0145 family)
MKYFTPTAISIKLCEPDIKAFESFSSTFALDFSHYTEKGFYLSPESYPGAFTPVGVISKTLYPGAKKNTYQSSQYYQEGWWSVEEIDRNRILEEMYQEAISMGANGIVNLKVELGSRQADGGKLILPFMNVEAFAIRV